MYFFLQMMISVFRDDEIRCWADMSDSGYAPSLYLFKIEDNKVSIHMEILHKGKGSTLTSLFMLLRSGSHLVLYGINHSPCKSVVAGLIPRFDEAM